MNWRWAALGVIPIWGYHWMGCGVVDRMCHITSEGRVDG